MGPYGVSVESAGVKGCWLAWWDAVCAAAACVLFLSLAVLHVAKLNGAFESLDKGLGNYYGGLAK